jgi:hypothetical protein
LANFAAIMNLFDQSVSQFPLQQAVLLAPAPALDLISKHHDASAEWCRRQSAHFVRQALTAYNW